MSIRLSPKHGVNPALMKCPLCFQNTGVALLGHLAGDAQAPYLGTRDTEPCAECMEHMKMGILLLEREGDTITGTRWVITHEAAARAFPGFDFSKGVAYIEPGAARKMGLYKSLDSE